MNWNKSFELVSRGIFDEPQETANGFKPAFGAAILAPFLGLIDDGAYGTRPSFGGLRSSRVWEENGISVETQAPDITGGVVYSHQYQASGRTPPYTYEVLSGDLPDGVILTPSGLLTGISCDMNGNFHFNVRITDAEGEFGDFEGNSRFTVRMLGGGVNCELQEFIVLPEDLPEGFYNEAYTQVIFLVGGGDGYIFELVSGSLPTGMTLNESGLLIGLPQQTGSFPFEVDVIDNSGSGAGTTVTTVSYTLVINETEGLELFPETMPDGSYEEPYAVTLTGQGGDGNYVFTLESGSLPSGVTLSPTGQISGVPTETGSFSPTFKIVDGQDNEGGRGYSFDILPKDGLLSISPTTLPDAQYDTAYSQTLSATGGDGIYTFAIKSGALPAGLALAESGEISGSPSETGTFQFVAEVTDGQNNTGEQAFTLVVDPIDGLIVIDPATVPNASYSVFYSISFSTIGGEAPYTGSLTGILPLGMGLDPATGNLAGTPLETGSFNFNISVEDVHGNTGNQVYTLVVDPVNTLVIQPDALANGTYGIAYSATLSAEGGDGVYTFTVLSGSLPAGVTLSPDGTVSGTPTEAGAFNFLAHVEDGQGNTGDRTISLVIDPIDSLVIAPPALPDGAFDAPYSQTLTASGGDGAYEFSLVSGALPQGLSLAADGTLAGVPSQTGTFEFQAGVVDGQNNTGVAGYSLVIVPVSGLFELTPDTLPDATFGVAYDVTVDTTGGVAPFVGQLTGTLPVGISFDTTTGKISGTPTETGTFPINVKVIDAEGNTGEKDYSLVVNPVTNLSILPASLNNGLFNQAYAQQLTAEGGSGGYLFTVAAGALPDGLTLTTDGLLSGTPNDTGSFTFTASVTDVQSNSGLRVYTLVIEALDDLVILPGSLSDGVYGSLYSETLAGSGGVAPYSFSLVSGALPIGLTLASDGTLSGTPLETGAFSFTAGVQDDKGNTGQRAYSLDIAASLGLLTITPDTLANATYGRAYAETVGVEGGTAPYTLTLTGDLPAGVTFDAATGKFSGTPTVTGSFPIQVDAIDSQGNTGSRAYQLVVDPLSNLSIAPAVLPQGEFGTAYTAAVTASGGDGAYSFVVGQGALPAGLTLNTDGTISGVPSSTGDHYLRIDVSDGQGNTGSKYYDIKILAIDTLLIAPTTLADGAFGTAYSATLTASGGDGSYAFSVASGSLPNGITLNSDGSLGGTPLETGSFAFTAAVLDGENNTGSRSYTLVIDPVDGAITVNPAVLPEGTFNSAYTVTLTVEGGVGPYVGALTGALPVGLSFNPTNGQISGTPTETGSFPLTANITDSQGNTGQRNYTLLINTLTDLVIAPDDLADGVFASPYTQILSATGGDGAYRFAVASGRLPGGITLATDGSLSGTPTETGDFNFVATVTDGQNNSGQKQYALRIEGVDNLVIAPATLPDGTYGTAYSQTLTASGGAGGYTFLLLSGALPEGMSLATGGTLSGTPTQTGTFNFSVGVVDAQGNTGSINYALVIDTVDGLITVAPPTMPAGTYGQAYNLSLSASGGETPYATTLTGALPSGMAYDAGTGRFSGTPVETGSFPLTVDVTDAVGNTGQANYTLVIDPITTIAISPNQLGEATFGAPYSQTLTATGGDGVYTFGVSSGSLPAGITLSNAGVLSGNPSEAGDFNFVVQVTDGQGNTGTRSYRLTVARLSNLTIAPATLPEGVYNTAYAQVLTASGGDGAYAFSVATGSLPSGLALAPDGSLSGTPTETGTFNFDAKVLDGQGNTGQRSYTLVIQTVNTLTIQPLLLLGGTFGQAYSAQLTASGGDGSYQFAVSAGALPAGLILDADGGLQGTPTVTGTFNFTVEVTDGQNNTGTRAYSITVSPIQSVNIAPDALPDGVYASAYSQTLSASGGDGSYIFTLGDGVLPAGVTLAPTGVLGGTPTVTGDFNFRVDVVDTQGNTGSQQYSLRVDPADILSITPTSLVQGTYGVSYSETLVASGGDGSYQFSLVAGVLPAGLTLSNAGVLSGTPEETGSFGITVSVQDGQGNTGDQNYVLIIDPVDGLIAISPPTLPDAISLTSYVVRLSATGGDGNYTGRITQGRLPYGITFDPDTLTIEGIAFLPQTQALTIEITDGQGNTGTIDYTLTIVPATGRLVLAPAALPDGVFNLPYDQTVTASEGVAPYTFAVTVGSLPTGVSLSSDGRITGTPTETGNFSFTIEATDAISATGTANYGITIETIDTLAISPSTLSDGTFGVAYSETLTASGGVGGYSFSVSTGVLPSGLTLAADGTLRGAPDETGTFNFTAQVTDGEGNTGTRNYALVIDPVDGLFDLTPASLPDGTFGVSYNVTIDTTGGIAPFSGVLTGALPTGLSFDTSNGKITGIPQETGSFPVNIVVTDVHGNTGERDYALVVSTISTLVIAPDVLPDATYGTTRELFDSSGRRFRRARASLSTNGRKSPTCCVWVVVLASVRQRDASCQLRSPTRHDDTRRP